MPTGDGKISQTFADKVTPILTDLAALKPKSQFTPSMNSAIDTLTNSAKGDTETSAARFISNELMYYTKSEGKPTETTTRKGCIRDLLKQVSVRTWGIDKSKACGDVQFAIDE